MVSVKMGEPQFEGQTKTKLGNSEVKGFVQRVDPPTGSRALARGATLAEAQGRSSARPIQAAHGADRGPQGARARPGARALLEIRWPARQALRLPAPRTRPRSEIFIVEGDSAGGSAKSGRNPMHPGDPADPGQDPQRREGPDRSRSSPNNEVQALITAFGTGIGEDFDLARSCRYHKIVLMADADVDGHAHPDSAADPGLFRFMRPLIEAGLRLPRTAAALPAQVEQPGLGARSSPTPTASATAMIVDGRSRGGAGGCPRTDAACSVTRASAR